MLQGADLCVYYVNVKTMQVRDPDAGTDSVVSLTLGDKEGNRVVIRDLVDWGRQLMPPDHVFFQSGNLDHLGGLETCLASEPCYINLTASGTGHRPSWGCDYVEVKVEEVGEKKFYIAEWLTKEIDYSIVRELCPHLGKEITGCNTGSLEMIQ